MSEMSCQVIRDLLPLYADGALSDESRALVERHLAECGDCRLALARMKEEIPAPRAEEPGVAEALKGLRRALKRTKIKLIAVAVAAALLLAWVGSAVWGHVVMTWEVRVPPEDIVMTDFCHTTSGLILYRDSMKDGLAAEGIFTQYVEADRAIYIDYSRLKLHPVKESDFFADQWEWIDTTLRAGQFVYPTRSNPDTLEPAEWGVVTSIRIGNPDDYVTAWQEGTDIPLADPQTDEWYEYYMNPPGSGNG
jgi:hypothetical protein